MGLVVCLALGGGPACADDAAPSLVGQVSAIGGSVKYQGGGDWSDALVNEPVAAGVGLRSGRDAEAELHLAGIRIALAPSSELRVLRADRDVLQITLLQGRIGVHLERDGAPRTVEIDLPRGGAWLDAPGDYDIATADGQAPDRVGVFTGTVRLGGGLDARDAVAAESDIFSDWWRSRDENADKPVVDRLSPVIAGAAALDTNGRWEADAKYGEVWYPSAVADDWTPYREGVWRFLPPWGWTWVDDAPWGFAPSHYGRWVRLGDRWAWVPGPQGGDPDYSPAVVAFLGTAGIGLSRPGDAGPAVAWFPLAPGETVGDGGEAGYQNRRFATAVPRAVFAGGRAAAPALVDLPEQRFADAPVILQGLDIPPAATVAIAAAPKRAGAVLLATVTRAIAAPVRRIVLARLHQIPVHAAHKRVAQTVAPRPLPAANVTHTTHGRRHLAATNGGA